MTISKGDTTIHKDGIINQRLLALREMIWFVYLCVTSYAIRHCMLIKINRQNCLTQYQTFPLRSYNYANDEDEFFYPNVFKSYILTLHSKSFRGHAKLLGIELTKLIKELEWNSLIFLGDTELPWLNQDNDYKPAKEAQQYLSGKKLGKRFNGAIKVDQSELPIFIKHLSWLTRCNASLPYFHFTNEEQNFIGHICKYGNFHLDTLNQESEKIMKTVIAKSSFKFLNGNNCYNQFSKTSAIAGRQIII